MILFYFVLFFLFIFGPVFNTIGTWADSIFFISILLSIYHLFNKKNSIPSYVNYFSVLIPLSIFTSLIASFYPKITFGDLFQIIFKPIRIIITLIGAYSLFILIYNKYAEKYISIILNFIFFSVVVHAIIMIFQFHYIPFKEFVYNYTNTGEYRSTFEYDFRMGGLSGGSGGAVLSVVQSIGIIILPFLLNVVFTKNIKYLYFTCALIIFYSILLCGRSGIWSTLMFLPFSILLASKSNIFIKSFNLIKIIVLIFLILFLIINFFNSELDESNPVFYALNRSLDSFLNYNETGVFEDQTVNTLKTHILLPSDIKTILIGDTEVIVNSQFERSLNSDIGYIRNIWGLGLFGTILYILPMLKISSLSLKFFFYSNISKLLLLISFITLFFHFKERYIYTRMLFSIYSLILALFFFEVYMKKNQSK